MFSNVLIRVTKDAAYSLSNFSPFPDEIREDLRKLPEILFNKAGISEEKDLSSRLWVSVARTSWLHEDQAKELKPDFVRAEVLAAALVCIFDVYASLADPKAKRVQEQFAEAVYRVGRYFENEEAAKYFRSRATEGFFFPSPNSIVVI